MGVFGSIFKKKGIAEIPNNRGWTRWVMEPFTGAWQRNKELAVADMLGYHAVFSCITLISGDVSKMSVSEMVKSRGVWESVRDSAVSELLARPNQYQNGGQFFEHWTVSKLAKGNTYVYRETDSPLSDLHILDPDRVKVLVSDNGQVFYEISENKLAALRFAENEAGQVTVPAERIIHDRFNCLYHPLVGISPLYAAALPVLQGREIQKQSSTFFSNGAMPGGILTAPGAISDETAERLRRTWDEKYSGAGRGKVAVVGDGLSYQPLSITAVDSQLVEQLKWSAEVVCSVFHVPPHKIHIGPIPSNDSIQALNQEYFSQCLQRLIIDIQRLLRVHFKLGDGRAVRFDIDSLMMMDPRSQMEVFEKGTKIGAFEPNFVRRKFNQPPVEGGDTPYLQQQNFPLAALARQTIDPPATTPQSPEQDPEAVEERALVFAALVRKELGNHDNRV